MRKYFFMLLLIVIVPILLTACSSDNELRESAIVKIGETEFNSLSEAVVSSEVGDTILVYNDVKEDISANSLQNFKCYESNDNVYVAYEIKKPLTIKGVIQNGDRPKVYGSFFIELSDEKFKDSHITIENMEIIHDYVSINNNEINEQFSAGVRVVNGSANIVDNYIHMSKDLSDDIIQSVDLPLFYGIMMSRPLESELSDISFNYDIINNMFGEYRNQKGGSYSGAFIINENSEGVGEFFPSKINTASYNFSLAIYNYNDNENNSMIYACDWDTDKNQYNSLITNNKGVVDFSKLTKPESRFLFNGDYGGDEEIKVNVYGTMVFNGNVKNVVFNLMNENAKVEIIGEKLGSTKIIKLKK